MTDLVKPPPTALVLQDAVPGLVELWLQSQTPNTRRTYQGAIEDFAKSISQSLDVAVSMLLAARGAANALAMAYRIDLGRRNKANSTVNLRLSALRSLVAHARSLDLVDWALEVRGVAQRQYRDTRGPGRAGFQKMLEAARKSPSAARDVAILWSLYGLALRRAEVSSLDVADVDLAGGILMVISKGSGGEKIGLTMPPPLRAALSKWLEVRGTNPGPLFLNRDHARPVPTRLSTEGILTIVRVCGNTTGMRVRPHGLRHSAITAALDLTHGDLRAVQRFSRHKDIKTIGRYDDNRSDLGGQVAALVATAAALETPE